jgi:hypothetical protein
VGDGEGDGLGEGDLVGDGEGDGLGEGDLVGDGEGDGLGEGDLLGDGDGALLGDGLGEGGLLGDGEGDGAGELVDVLGEGDGLARAAPPPSRTMRIPAAAALPPARARGPAARARCGARPGGWPPQGLQANLRELDAGDITAALTQPRPRRFRSASGRWRAIQPAMGSAQATAARARRADRNAA